MLWVIMRGSRNINQLIVGNQHKWDSLGPERSGVWWSLGELPEGPVMKSSPNDGLSLHLDSGGLDVF